MLNMWKYCFDTVQYTPTHMVTVNVHTLNSWKTTLTVKDFSFNTPESKTTFNVPINAFTPSNVHVLEKSEPVCVIRCNKSLTRCLVRSYNFQTWRTATIIPTCKYIENYLHYQNANPPDGKTWLCLKKNRMQNIIPEISIYPLVLGAAGQYLASIVTNSDALTLYNVTLDNRRKDAWSW